jgi:hypothetical protein
LRAYKYEKNTFFDTFCSLSKVQCYKFIDILLTKWHFLLEVCTAIRKKESKYLPIFFDEKNCTNIDHSIVLLAAAATTLSPFASTQLESLDEVQL